MRVRRALVAVLAFGTAFVLVVGLDTGTADADCDAGGAQQEPTSTTESMSSTEPTSSTEPDAPEPSESPTTEPEPEPTGSPTTEPEPSASPTAEPDPEPPDPEPCAEERSEEPQPSPTARTAKPAPSSSSEPAPAGGGATSPEPAAEPGPGEEATESDGAGSEPQAGGPSTVPRSNSSAGTSSSRTSTEAVTSRVPAASEHQVDELATELGAAGSLVPRFSAHVPEFGLLGSDDRDALGSDAAQSPGEARTLNSPASGNIRGLELLAVCALAAACALLARAWGQRSDRAGQACDR